MVGDGVEPRHGLVHRQEQPLDQLHQRLPAETVVPRRFHRPPGRARSGPGSPHSTSASTPPTLYSAGGEAISMGTGAKIAIGCGCVVLLAAAAVVGVARRGRVVGQGQDRPGHGRPRQDDGRDRGDRALREEGERQRLHPAGRRRHPRGPLPEVPRRAQAGLRRLRDATRRELREIQKKADSSTDKLTLSELWSAGGSLAEMAGAIRLAQVKALADAGMSESRVPGHPDGVYKSAWASELAESTGPARAPPRPPDRRSTIKEALERRRTGATSSVPQATRARTAQRSTRSTAQALSSGAR